MQLDRYVDEITRQLALVAATGGPEAEELAERLVLPLRSAVRLALLDALASAADELTLEMAPGSVELRLRGGEPTFVVQGLVSAPSSAPSAEAVAPASPDRTGVESDDGGSTRINLRMPDSLKARVESAALGQGRSVNAWLVRAVTAALEPERHTPTSTADVQPTTARRSSSRMTGWAL